MSGRVHANPDDLKRLRRDIEQAQRDISEAVRRLKGSLSRADWDDGARRNFEEQLNSLTNSLRTFDRGADQLKPVLDRKVRELEAFLR